jgi:glycosyltransferase involved in cell wall biosynthesis
MIRKPYLFFIHDTVVIPKGQRGVSRCFSAYRQALYDEFPGQVSVFTSRDEKSRGIRVISNPFMRIRSVTVRNALSRIENWYGALLADQTSGVYYSPFYGYMHTRIPQVFSAYDMIYERLPQYFPLSEFGVSKHIREKRACFERAALIICISKNTANDILEIYPHVPKERIAVVPLGVDEGFFQDGVAAENPRPYFLFVGHRERYKNFLRFLEAFGRSGLKKEFDLSIVSPIPDELTAREMEAVKQNGLSGSVKMVTSISDAELKKRYAGASAFVYPTEYEGFGLPVVEALASGTLVLCSNTSSLPEVGGTAPLYFDPCSADAMAEMMCAAVRMTDSERQERIQTGKAWAAHFTWEKSKQGFLCAVRDLLDRA